MFTRISSIFIGSPRFYLGLSIILIALGGVFQTATADIEANKAIVQRWVELWNTGDLAIADEIFATDFVNHDLYFPDVTDLSSYKGYVVLVHTGIGISDIHLTVHDVVAQGDKVAYRYTTSYTIPDGKRVTVTAINIDHFANGKIVEEWWNYDFLGQRQQWGVMPPTREDYTWGVPSEVTGDPGTPETNKAITLRAEELWNTGNLAIADEIFATDFVNHDLVLPDVVNLESYKGFVAVARTAFPDFHITVEDMVAEDDKVVIRRTVTATHQGEFVGIPPTGRQVKWTAMTIYRFADGKIVECWWSYDALGLLQQLTAPTEEEANKAVVQRWVELWNTGNLAIADEIFATDYVSHVPHFPHLTDRESYKGQVTSDRTDIPDLHVTVEDMVAEGDKVATRFTVTGTPQSVGVQYTNTTIAIFHFADGKIVEEWFYHDMLGVLEQLGVMPRTRKDYGWGVPSEVTGKPGTPEENKELVKHLIGEVLNKQNLAVLDEIMAANVVFHDPVTGDIIGIEGFKQFLTMYFTAFPDLHFTIEDGVAEGHEVAIRYTSTGTHKGELMGIPPTGLPPGPGTPGMIIYRFADGKIVEIWSVVDNLGMLQRLGVIPSMVPKDYSNVFFMPLTPGLNMVSLPLEPRTPYTARTFAETLFATTVIKLDEKRQRFVGFTLDAPDDGFAIEGGKGYIVNVPEGRVVSFTGAAWTNQPPVEASPSLAQSDGAWAFAVSGRLKEDSQTSEVSGDFGSLYLVTVRNTRTNAVATDVAREGYFAAAFADLTRKNVVKVGDQLEVTVRTDDFVSEPFLYTVTPEAIRQAFLPITLGNNPLTPFDKGDVEIPRRSLLLQNYPNPFNPETWIPYQLRESSEVVIRIYNAQGQLVRTLSLGQCAAGFYLSRTRAAYWNGLNSAGEKVASGIYFYQLRAGDFSSTRRMLILK